MKKGKYFFAIALTIIIGFANHPLNAQQDSIPATGLDEVVVTATKFAKSQSETGKVMTIIDESQIKLSAGKDISQLLNEQVGLFINGANSNPGKDKSIYLRGAKSEYTVILLDGIPLNDPSAIGGGAYDLRLIPLDQVERIEILKGNQSTLYGSNAIAGVINIITKKDDGYTRSGVATIGYGSFNTFKTSIGISESASKWGYNIGMSRLTTNGISEAKDTIGTENFDKDGFTQNAFNANVTWKPTTKFQLKPYFRFADFDGKYDGGPFTDNTKNTYQSTFYNSGVSSLYQLGKGSIHMYYGYDNTDRVFLDSAYGFTSTYSYKGRFHHGEVFVNYDVTKNIQLLGGGSFQRWRMAGDLAMPANSSVVLVSPYASFFIRNLAGFSAELGGRFNQHSKYGSNFTYSFNPSYLIAEKVKLFVNVSSGFKAPSISQLFGPFGANESLKPETSRSEEAGVEISSKKKKSYVRIVAFQRTIDDVIFYAFRDGYINQDKQKDKGFDLETSVTVRPNLTLKSFYSFVNGSLFSEGSSTPDNLYRIPKHTIGLNAVWQVMPRLTVSANFKSVGKRTDVFFNAQTFLNDEVNLNGFQLFDVYLEYVALKGQLKIFMDTKNLLNQNYYEVYGYATMAMNVTGGVALKL